MYRYKKIRLKDGKTIDEHRMIMQNHLGRKLTFNEVVHHINDNPRDNRIENLQVISRSKHTSYHQQRGDYALPTEEQTRKGRETSIKNRSIRIMIMDVNGNDLMAVENRKVVSKIFKFHPNTIQRSINEGRILHERYKLRIA